MDSINRSILLIAAVLLVMTSLAGCPEPQPPANPARVVQLDSINRECYHATVDSLHGGNTVAEETRRANQIMERCRTGAGWTDADSRLVRPYSF